MVITHVTVEEQLSFDPDFFFSLIRLSPLVKLEPHKDMLLVFSEQRIFKFCLNFFLGEECKYNYANRDTNLLAEKAEAFCGLDGFCGVSAQMTESISRRPVMRQFKE